MAARRPGVCLTRRGGSSLSFSAEDAAGMSASAHSRLVDGLKALLMPAAFYRRSTLLVFHLLHL